MKLYINQRVFSIGDKYDIYDEQQNAVYHVESELFTINAKLHLYNMQRQEMYYIKRKFTLFFAEYEIYQQDNLVACINQELSFFHPKLNVESVMGNFVIEGDFMSMDYQLSNDGAYFGSIQKKWFSWGDSYELDVANDENTGFFCALVIAIDNCLHNESSN